DVQSISQKIKKVEQDYPLIREEFDQLTTSITLQEATIQSVVEQIDRATKRAEKAQQLFQEKLQEAKLEEDFEDDLLTAEEANSAKEKVQNYHDAVRLNLQQIKEQLLTLESFPDNVTEEELAERW